MNLKDSTSVSILSMNTQDIERSGCRVIEMTFKGTGNIYLTKENIIIWGCLYYCDMYILLYILL